MKIVITGAGGLLGRDLWLKLQKDHETWAVGRQKPEYIPLKQWRVMDVLNPAETYSLTTRLNPDLIIHAAALSNVDQCEITPDEAYRVNALGTRNIALACQRFDTVFMHLSTNYIFSGADCPPAGYREFDPAGPVNHYGISKKWAEDFVMSLLNKFYIVRTAGLFGSARSCFVTNVIKACQTGQPIRITSEWTGSVTSTIDLAQALSKLAQSNLYGIYHITNTGQCSRLDLANYIASKTRVAPGFEIRCVKPEELKLSARRPLHSNLDNLQWRLSGFEPLKHWKLAVSEFLIESTRSTIS